MKAITVNFRGGPRTRHNRDIIIRPIDKFEGALIGKKVGTHGSEGYRVRFTRGLPGWAIGSEVEVL
jgi:ribosomal protein L35AE/L33A